VDEPPDGDAQWPDQIFGHFKRARIRQVGYVPDAGHSRLIQRCIEDPEIIDVLLTSEEEGVGLVSGAALAGDRAALLMQSSGVGNCVNMFSLLKNGGFSTLVLVTMRGEFAEFNPWQVPMAAITAECFRLCGFVVHRADHENEIDEIVGGACDMAFDGGTPIAVLLSQRLIGRKKWISR
jgi:sulfopyruvate decarboxylase TPP-binding subunit